MMTSRDFFNATESASQRCGFDTTQGGDAVSRDPTVLIHFYAAKNLGDDLFLLTLIDRYPNIRFLLRADDRSLLPGATRNNLEIMGPGVDDKESDIDVDCLCQIGGSIFIEPNGPGVLGFYRTVRMIARRKHLYSSAPHAFVLGANWGPCRHRFFYTAFKNLFRRVIDDICFRDTASYELFKDLPNVRYAPDILFSLRLPVVEKRRSALFSVVDLSRKDKFGEISRWADTYFAWMTNAAEWLHQRGYAIVLSSFCEREGDEDAVNLLASRLSKRGVSCEKHLYRGDVEKALYTISECEVVVATRFHAMVLGIVSCARVLPVPYSMKTVNVLNDIGFSMDNVVDVSVVSSDDMSFCARVEASCPLSVDSLKTSAEGHFRILDRFLIGR